MTTGSKPDLINLQYVALRKWVEEHEQTMRDWSRKTSTKDSFHAVARDAYQEAASLIGLLDAARIFVFGDLMGPVGNSRDDGVVWSDFQTPFQNCWFEGTRSKVAGTDGEWIRGVFVESPSTEYLADHALRFYRETDKASQIAIFENPKYDTPEVRATMLKAAESVGAVLIDPPLRHVHVRLFFQHDESIGGERRTLWDHYWLSASLDVGQDPATTEVIPTKMGDNAKRVFAFARNLVSFLTTSDVESEKVEHGRWRDTPAVTPKQVEKQRRREQEFPPFYRVKVVGRLKKLVHESTGQGRPLTHASWTMGHFKRYRYCAGCGSVNAIQRVLAGEACKRCGTPLVGAVTRKRWCPPFVRGLGEVKGRPVYDVRQDK